MANRLPAPAPARSAAYSPPVRPGQVRRARATAAGADVGRRQHRVGQQGEGEQAGRAESAEGAKVNPASARAIVQAAGPVASSGSPARPGARRRLPEADPGGPDARPQHAGRDGEERQVVVQGRSPDG